jgi:hypothetical protein
LQTLTKRSEIAREHTWDLESIFPTNDDWENSFKRLQQSLPELEALKGTLAQSGQALFAVLQKRDELFEELETLYVYASMRKDEDTTNSTYLRCLIALCNCMFMLLQLSPTSSQKSWPCRKQRLTDLCERLPDWAFMDNNWTI